MSPSVPFMSPNRQSLAYLPFIPLRPFLFVTWKTADVADSDISDPRPPWTPGITHSVKHKNTSRLPLTNSPFSPSPNPQRGCEPLFHLNNPHWINKRFCFVQSGWCIRLSRVLSLMCHHYTSHPQWTRAERSLFPPSVGECMCVRLTVINGVNE